LKQDIKRELLLCFSHLRWNFVYQRPHHLLTRAADTYDVIYFEEPLVRGSDAPLLLTRKDVSGVNIVTPVLREGLSLDETAKAQQALIDEMLSGLPAGQERVLWYYTPMALAFSRHLSSSLSVYDVMDELAGFAGAPPELVLLERELYQSCDLVFVGGQSLFEFKKSRHPFVELFPSSIDAAHFHAARALRSKFKGRQRMTVGFFGVIDERMDLDLVANIADLRPRWLVEMIGPTAKIDPARLPVRDNIIWKGPKPYAELPDLISGWSAGLMPFAHNDATRFISPTKTPEFLAAGLPVVSTAIADVVHPYGEMGFVEIADDAEGFVLGIEKVLARPMEPWLQGVDRFLACNSWDMTWAGMKRSITAARIRANKPKLAFANV
jgi:UDP-galactopyranose mutase